MAGLFAVVVVMLLAIAASIAYVLVLRELRRINTSLEQFIKLIVDARNTGAATDEAAPAPAQYQPQSSSWVDPRDGRFSLRPIDRSADADGFAYPRRKEDGR
jgi:hypothetical protein